MFRFRQRLFAWIAIFAMMLGALAPAVSRAMASGADGLPLIEVCSAAGSRWVVLDAAEAALYGVHDGRAGQGDGSIPGVDHCPYCCAHGGAALPPAPSSAALPAPAASAYTPRLFLLAPRTLFAWAPGYPRAPPAGA